MPVEILVNFVRNRDWSVHCMTEDARTPISPVVYTKKKETLIRLLRYIGAGDAEIAEVEALILLWSEGSVRIHLTPGRKNLLHIRVPWNCDLDD